MSAPSRTNCVADGDSMGIRSSETPATAANSNSAHPMAVAGPRTRTAEDQVGSRSDMRYGARTSHALITWMDHRDKPYLHGGLKGTYLEEAEDGDEDGSLLIRLKPRGRNHRWWRSRARRRGG